MFPPPTALPDGGLEPTPGHGARSEAAAVEPIRAVIACGSLRPELERLAARQARPVETLYLPQSLHRSPERLGAVVARALERVGPTVRQVVLGFGWCSGGLRHVRAPRQGLWVPRVHDCIALLLGSRQAYAEAFRRRPGTYYLTPGWLREQKDPLGCLEHDYVPRVGRDDAEWALRCELEHYTHIVLIDTGAAPVAGLRARARQNARFLDKCYEEVAGSSAYLERLIGGPCTGDDFVYVPPGEPVPEEPFLR